MSQNNSNEKLPSMAAIETINEVQGFDPAPFAVEYTDLNSNESRKRLPVMIQMAWFRLKYPEGKIAVQVNQGKDCFVATARVYPSYKDPIDCYLAEATASRGYCTEKPSVSPREWAQTAAVGIALRNAGFGLQFSMAGEDFDDVAPNEFGTPHENMTSVPRPQETIPQPAADPESEPVEQPPVELTPEEKLNQALQTACPIAKYKDKTLGDVLMLDQGAIKWLANKFTGDEHIKEAAQRICEYAVQQTTA